MSNIKSQCSLSDTTELRKLILENPDLPLLIFCGEEAWDQEWAYSQADASSGEISELVLYNDRWIDRDDYEENLRDGLCDKPEYEDLSDEDYDKMIAEKIRATEFVRAIVIYVG